MESPCAGELGEYNQMRRYDAQALSVGELMHLQIDMPVVDAGVVCAEGACIAIWISRVCSLKGSLTCDSDRYAMRDCRCAEHSQIRR